MEAIAYPKNRIKELREQRSMTLRELAERTGWLNQTLSNLELSKAELTWSKLTKLAEIFDCNPLDLVSVDYAWAAQNMDERALLQAFRRMNEDQSNQLLEQARKLAKIGGTEFIKMRGQNEFALYGQPSARNVTVHERGNNDYDAETVKNAKPGKTKRPAKK